MLIMNGPKVKELEKQVSERDVIISERDATISEKDATISEKDVIICNLENENLELQKKLQNALSELTQIKEGKQSTIQPLLHMGTSINDVPCFLAFFDLPTTYVPFRTIWKKVPI